MSAGNTWLTTTARASEFMSLEHSGTLWWRFLHFSSADHTVEPLFKEALKISNNLIFFFTKQCPCSADYSKTLIIYVQIDNFFHSDKDVKIPGVTAFLPF